MKQFLKNQDNSKNFKAIVEKKNYWMLLYKTLIFLIIIKKRV